MIEMLAIATLIGLVHGLIIAIKRIGEKIRRFERRITYQETKIAIYSYIMSNPEPIETEAA